LLDAASKSRCRSYTRRMLALNTGMRASEIRSLTWQQVDFLGSALTVGKSKTLASTGRMIPLNPRALGCSNALARPFRGCAARTLRFPAREVRPRGKRPPTMRLGDCPEQPMHRWKAAWERARKTAGVPCRFHDLRHTFVRGWPSLRHRIRPSWHSRGTSPGHDGALLSHPDGSQAPRCGYTLRGRF